MQKQINTEEDKQMNLQLCASSSHIGLFPQCQNQQSRTSATSGPSVAAAFHLSNLRVCPQYQEEKLL